MATILYYWGKYMSTKENQVEELSLNYADIEGPITLPVLQDRVEEITEENLVYRECFRDYDATDISSNVVQIPVPNDDGAHPKLVDEGAEYPRSHEEYELKTMEFDKFGFEVPLTMEAVDDSRVDLTQDQVDRQARKMAEDVNARAFQFAHSAIDSVGGYEGDDGGTFTYDDLLQGREYLLDSAYSPDMLVANVEAVHDLLQADNFLRATEEGDNLRRSGEVGEIAGMTVIEDDSGLPIGRSQGPAAMMVDSELFGYEGARTPITTEEYTEERTQTDVYRIFTRMGWLVTQPEAGVIIEG
jgi:HK97 family phage major capsid protein